MADATAKKILPYRNFKFHIYFEGKKDPVALVSKMSALKRTTEVVNWRHGGAPNVSIPLAGKTTTPAINLERGLCLDDDFEDWAGRVNSFDSHLAQKDNDFRKELRIEILDLDGNVVLKYKLHNCWVSEYTALPDLDANANAVAISTIKIENEGWERDK